MMPTKRVILAEYFTVEDRTLLFIVRDDFEEPEVIEIPVGTEAIQQFVIKHFQEERNAAGQVVKSTGDKLRTLDESAYQSFFAPFVAPLVSNSSKKDIMTKEGDIIWFVPHNFLHYLPLHALKVEGRYLIERNPVCYTPSASVMKYCHAKRKGKRNTALVLGDSRSDLAHACEEASTVAGLFNTTPYLQERATKSLLKQKLEKDRESLDILHFCCHGRFRQDDALKSCIVLAPEGEGDEEWNLTAEEVLQLQMQAELVTLSACETGINENRPGDELIGLTRALIYAGTPSVIVSLWAVDDLSSGLLMEHFYNKFRQTTSDDSSEFVSKAEALQAASLYVKNLTARDLIDYCNQRLSQLTPEEQTFAICFQLAMGNAEIMAGNLQAGISIYEEIQNQLLSTPTSQRPNKLVDNVRSALASQRLKAKLYKKRGIPPVNYEVQPFSTLFHWVPFILVGDWK